MNRKQEDALVRLAFGDTTPEEASALERQAFSDPDSARALATYRRMREGLKDLHDVPADQLSKERLRDAILSRGLKPKPVPAQRSWLWMPAMAAVLAFGITIARHNSQPAGLPGVPSILSPSGSGPFAINVLPPRTDFSSSNYGTSSPTKTYTASASATPHASRNLARRHRSHVAPAAIETPTPSAIRPDDLFTYVMPDASHDDPAPVASAAGATDHSKDAIIIIGPQKDGDTGAATATEVKSPTHVVTSG